MSIAPVVSTVTVKVRPAKAFTLFTQHMSQWWQPGSCDNGKKPWKTVTLEPKVGGRLYETDADGNDSDWGTVLAFEPPHRLLLGWNMNSTWKFDPNFVTEVEITFRANADGGTEVRLEHRNLERFGADAEKLAAQLGGGWPTHFKGFAAFVAQQED